MNKKPPSVIQQKPEQKKWVKISRNGYPADTPCELISVQGTGSNSESKIKLPSGEIVNLYTAFTSRCLPPKPETQKAKSTGQKDRKCA